MTNKQINEIIYYFVKQVKSGIITKGQNFDITHLNNKMEKDINKIMKESETLNEPKMINKMQNEIENIKKMYQNSNDKLSMEILNSIQIYVEKDQMFFDTIEYIINEIVQKYNEYKYIEDYIEVIDKIEMNVKYDQYHNLTLEEENIFLIIERLYVIIKIHEIKYNISYKEVMETIDDIIQQIRANKMNNKNENIYIENQDEITLAFKYIQSTLTVLKSKEKNDEMILNTDIEEIIKECSDYINSKDKNIVKNQIAEHITKTKIIEPRIIATWNRIE